MLPFCKSIKELIPFDVEDLLDKDKVEIFNQAPNNWVHKGYLPPETLNPKFLKFLQDKDLDVDKVLVWHWFCDSPHIAHIDCDENGTILPSAMNWTITDNKSCVHFYDMPDVEKTVMFGNEADTEWDAPNVKAYIPIDVKNEVPAATWNDQGPCIINTSVPHLIVAPEIRTSISLQFKKPVDILVLYEKLL
jgi:hypothetical protein